MEGARDSSTAVPHEQISYLGKAASSFPKERPDEQTSILEPPSRRFSIGQGAARWTESYSRATRQQPNEQIPILGSRWKDSYSRVTKEGPDEQVPILEPPGNSQMNRFLLQTETKAGSDGTLAQMYPHIL